ncbi:amino acid ABC transporter permease [Rhodoligotrophos defluvii]|uniref:amino acid ABC transporter permease n=1 Tax=Rhodoligotrophos defluvii TaxID=2561934 RepID=UPI0010CA0667|nr:amino acid ABC transporter permease [Rhodoligotrophos defluvii]
MTVLLDYLPALLQGLKTTLAVAVLSIVGCAITSVLLGIFRSARRLPRRVAAGAVVELLRGASALVYLFWAYYALPLIPGMPQLSPFAAAVLVLSLVGGAYGAEIVRAGIESVPRGQTDASRALGLSPFETLRLVILPQALSQIVPSFGSLAVDLVKWTTIVSFVGVQDVFYVANNIRNITYDTVKIYLMLAILYWVLCFVTSVIFRAVEWCLPLNRALRAGQPKALSVFSSWRAGRQPAELLQ